MNYESISSSSANSVASNSPFSRGLLALYGIGFLSGLSLGLFNPFISTFMSQAGASDLLIGANSTLYFLMIALGTSLVAKSLRRLGLRRTMILGFALMGVSAPLFPLTNQPLLWFLIRTVMGLACCLYLVSGQTALNAFCHDSNRAIVNGLNALVLALGFGVGPVIGSQFYHFSPIITFSVGSTLILSGIIIVLMALPETPVSFSSIQWQIFKKLTLPLQGSFAYGFAEATLVSLYPVYLLRNHYEIEQIGYTFGIFILGGLLATPLVTCLADRLGKFRILLLSVILVVLTLSGLSSSTSFLTTNILAFILGASISPIFPLSIALIGSKLPLSELASGSALFTAVYSIGCAAGPILSSVIMQVLGDHYLFSLMLMIFVFFLLSLIRQSRSQMFRV